MNPPLDAVTADGFDMQFGTNVVGWSLLCTYYVFHLLTLSRRRSFLLHQALVADIAIHCGIHTGEESPHRECVVDRTRTWQGEDGFQDIQGWP